MLPPVLRACRAATCACHRILLPAAAARGGGVRAVLYARACGNSRRGTWRLARVTQQHSAAVFAA